MKIRVVLPKRSTVEKNKEYLTHVQNVIKNYLTVYGRKVDDGTTIALKDFLINNGVALDMIANIPRHGLIALLVDISMIVTLVLENGKDNSLEVTLTLRELTIE